MQMDSEFGPRKIRPAIPPTPSRYYRHDKGRGPDIGTGECMNRFVLSCRNNSALAISICLLSAITARSAEPVIAFGERTVLMGADASRHGELKVADLGPGKVGWI